MQFTILIRAKEFKRALARALNSSLYMEGKIDSWIAVLFAEPGKSESSYCSEGYFRPYDSCVPFRFIFQSS